MLGLPVRFGGGNSNGPSDIESQPLIYSQRNQTPTSHRARLGSHGSARVLLAIVTLGGSELVKVIQDYRARRGENSSSKVQDCNFNIQLLTNELNGQPPIFPGAKEDALQEAEKKLSTIGKDAKSCCDKALNTMMVKAPGINGRLTEETFTNQLSQEIIDIGVKETLIQDLKAELGNRHLPNDEGVLATLMQVNEADIKALGRYPQEDFKSQFNSQIHKIADQGQTMRSYTQAKNDAQDAAVEGLMLVTGKSKEEAKRDPGIKTLQTKFTQEALKIEEKATQKNGGDMPAIPMKTYKENFQPILQEYLNEIGVNDTSF